MKKTEKNDWDKPSIKTLGELKKTGYQPKTIQAEIRENLIRRLEQGESSFTGLIGYENTVIPEMERALLSGHNINLLGLRGQAKTRMARQLTELLDTWVPVIEGAEINDDPMEPISIYGKNQVDTHGDDTPIDWLHKSDRFFEKLATPDVTVADLIGDVDPIKAANLKLSYADERVIHFGMIPRAHRCVFVLNELPDLHARIQVALFSILQEKEIQIRGFQLRLPILPYFVFTANPEDYTNRGSIVTPLKDRIGSQILTHYPHTVGTAKEITRQEARVDNGRMANIHIPELARDLIEQIGFEARRSEFVDTKSGVSARMSIAAFENLMSTAERRSILHGSKNTSLRLIDFMGISSALNGKVELAYEGEQEGAEQISFHLITAAIKTLFPQYFPAIEKLEKPGEPTPYDDLLQWFLKDNELYLDAEADDKTYQDTLSQLPALDALMDLHQPLVAAEDRDFFKEFLLWGLEGHQKLSKYRTTAGVQFKDALGRYIENL
ncbi:MAG: magnesium chelatase [Flavobacteriaceae bacterium]